MKVTLTMSTPEVEISNNAKICYGNSSDKDITSSIVHNHKHLASLRFAYATVNIQGISIACQNQMVRSSHLDFMVQSKRYVSREKGSFYFIYPINSSSEHSDLLEQHWKNTIELYDKLISEGMKKEDARSILPMNTSTEMNITGNLQGFWDMFKLRLSPHAQKEIRDVATEIYKKLSEVYPKVFTDEVFKEFSKGNK